MPPSPALLSKLAADWPPEKWGNLTVLVAVSGGADSVALARGLAQMRMPGEGRLVLAHFNHQLRGSQSDADQALVERLAEGLGVQIAVGKREGDGERGRGGEREIDRSEETLREARYAFLTQAASAAGARYIVTAHTADDQVETVLLNLLRGTGLAGLAGIPRLRQLTNAATMIRPLLAVTRAEVVEYLSALGQPYHEDASNRSLDYTRNRVRHALLPLLERDYNPHVRAAIRRLSRIAGETESMLDQQAEALLRFAAKTTPGSVEIAVDRLAGAHPVLIRQAMHVLWHRQDWPLQDMSFEKWEQLLGLAHASADEGAPQACMFPGGVRAERNSNLLRLKRA